MAFGTVKYICGYCRRRLPREYLIHMAIISSLFHQRVSHIEWIMSLSFAMIFKETDPKYQEK